MVAPAARAKPTLERVAYPAKLGRFVAPGFYAIEPQTVASIFSEGERGQLERYADLAEWITEDDRVESVLSTVLGRVASLDFELLPGRGDSALAKQAAEDCRRMLDEVESLELIFEECLMFPWLGYSALEHNWEWQDGLWLSTPTAIRSRDLSFSDSWKFQARNYGPDGNKYEWVNFDDHPNKFMGFAYRKRGSTPLRSGLVRSVAWYWLFKRWAIKFWNAGAERLANPIAIGKYGRDAADPARRALRTGLENLSDGQAVMLEESTGIEFPDTKFSTSADVWEKLVKKCDDGITIALMGSVDNVSSDGGSYARAESQADVTVDPRIERFAKLLYGGIERDWLTPYLHFNAHRYGGVVPPIPRMQIKRSEKKTIKEIFQYHLKGNLVKRNEVRAQLGLDALPPEQGGEELLDISDQPTGAPVAEFTAPASGGEPAALPLAKQLTLSWNPESRAVTWPKSTQTPSHSSEMMTASLLGGK